MKILIVSKRESELSRLLCKAAEEYAFYVPGELPEASELEKYDAFAILGGVEEEPLILWQDEKELLEAQLKRGARFLVEYIYGFGDYRSNGSTSKTRYARPVLMNNAVLGTNLQIGTLFDEQSNERILPLATGRSCMPILQYADNPKGFYCMPKAEEMKADESRFALWEENAGLLVCTFRMANFASAKFAPQRIWGEMIAAIVNWLDGNCESLDVTEMMQEAYRLRKSVETPAEVARQAMQWFMDADMVVERKGTPYCVLEGLSAHVRPDGTHEIGRGCRPDCTGEAALMFYLKSRLDQDDKALTFANGFRKFPTDGQIKSGLHAGFVSWTPNAYFACYQDDVARGFLLPELWRAYLSKDHSQLESVKLTLDYLLSTTGSDGLRVCRTDYKTLENEQLHCMTVRRNDGEKWKKWSWSNLDTTAKGLSSMPSGCPSAHYNAYYLASLLLYGKITGKKAYIAAGEKGLASLMSYYPETAREHSQTQELCRLILPLALLYWVTEDEEKKTWLYKVTEDLMVFAHPNGGYKEWDEGYIATCAGVADGESSVLSENGDPVADMLYSLNWLPMGFAAAYLTTHDEKFKTLWHEIAAFFSKVQIVSENKLINGVWPRSIDLDAFEVYGVPNDVGWAPWSVESGWTVAEIVSGLLMGEIIEKENL